MMQSFRDLKFLAGSAVALSLAAMTPEARGGLISELSMQIPFTESESGLSAETPTTESEFLHADPASVASLDWQKSEEPWIRIVQPLDETGHAAHFGAVLAGDSPVGSHSQPARRGGSGGAGGGGASRGAGSGTTSPGAIQNSASSSAPQALTTSQTVALGPQSSPTGTPASVTSEAAPLTQGSGTPAAQLPVSPPEQSVITENPHEESLAAIPEDTPLVPVADVSSELGVPSNSPLDEVISSGNVPSVTTEPVPVQRDPIAPLLYENPEPGSMLLLILGGVGLIVGRRAVSGFRRSR